VARQRSRDRQPRLPDIHRGYVGGQPLQAVSGLTSFAAEQDRSLLGIQLATNAKQKKLGKNTAHPEQTLPPEEET
jgi:hypothetical protein